jgi:hypothetical protein
MKLENAVNTLVSRTERAAMVALVLSARERERLMIDAEIMQLRAQLDAMQSHTRKLAKGDRS